MKYKYKDIYLDLKKMFYVSGQIFKGGCVCMNLCNFDVRETELKLNGTPIFFFFFTIAWTFSCHEQTKYGTMLSLWNCLINVFVTTCKSSVFTVRHSSKVCVLQVFRFKKSNRANREQDCSAECKTSAPTCTRSETFIYGGLPVALTIFHNPQFHFL